MQKSEKEYHATAMLLGGTYCPNTHTIKTSGVTSQGIPWRWRVDADTMAGVSDNEYEARALLSVLQKGVGYVSKRARRRQDR